MFDADAVDGMRRRMDRLDLSQSALSRATGVPQTSLSRWLKQQASPTLEAIAPAIDFLGGRLVWPDQIGSTTIDVHSRQGTGQWRGVPVVPWSKLGGWPRATITSKDATTHVVMPARHRAVDGRTQVVGVVVGESRDGMAPSCQPGDTLIVDIGEVHRADGDIVILETPTGDLRLCRLTVKVAGQDTMLMVTEDAKPGHFDTYSLASDYPGRGIGAVVAGVVTGLIR